MLPTEKSKIKTELSDYIILIYGPPKIGKTEFCTKIPDALFLATEPGGKASSSYKIDCNSWQDLQKAYEEIAAGNHSFKYIIIDTVDAALNLAKEQVKSEGVDKKGGGPPAIYLTQAAGGWGNGIANARERLKALISKFSRLPYGLVLIGHSRIDITETPAGDIKTETVCIYDGRTEEIKTDILSLVDFILFFTSKKGKNIIRSLPPPDKEYIAGGRLSWIPDGIEMDYAKVIEAWEINKSKYLNGLQQNQSTLDLNEKKKAGK